MKMDAQRKLIELVFRLANTKSNFEFLTDFKKEVDGNKDFDVLGIAIDQKLSEIKYEMAKEALENNNIKRG